MRTIIAGGRDYQLTDADRAWLDELRERLPITVVVSGAARGADTGAAEWARSRGIQVVEYPADWQRHGRDAGFRRNQEMVDVAEALVAFPGGSGTAHVKRQAAPRGSGWSMLGRSGAVAGRIRLDLLPSPLPRTSRGLAETF